MPSTLTETDLRYCDACDDEFDYEQFGWCCDSCSAVFCDDCSSCNNCAEVSDDVRPYDYRPPSFRPKGNNPGEVLFGVELEVGGQESRIVDVVQTYDPSEDHLYMKHDGSIDGVEIVTHPMTLAWARQYPFENLLAGLRAQGCDVGDEYGLHIHVSRNAFRRHGRQSCAHQMMWLLFMYRNVDDLTLLARRESDKWASFTAPMPGELARKATEVDNGARYVAVNCRNEKTFELRFFAATLDAREFLAALEFADASVQYTQDLRMSDVLGGGALTWSHFAEWLETRNYPNLSAEIEFAS